MEPSDDNEAKLAEAADAQLAPEGHVVGTDVGVVRGGIAGAALALMAGGPPGLAAGAAMGAAMGATLGAVAGYGAAWLFLMAFIPFHTLPISMGDQMDG